MTITLDEAIKHAEQVADNCEDEGADECADNHRQLAWWLRELRQARIEIDILKTLRDGFRADAKKYKTENKQLHKLVRMEEECALHTDCDDTCPHHYVKDGFWECERDDLRKLIYDKVR